MATWQQIDKITVQQINNMKHAIGYNPKSIKRNKYEAYRNYYSMSGNCKGWDYLVEIGFATKRSSLLIEGFTIYFLTKDGMDFIGNLSRCKITERD